MSEIRKPIVQVNTYRKSTFSTVKVLENRQLFSEEDGSEARHIVIETPENLKFREGQSIGVLVPGVNAKGKSNAVRLYSVASMGNTNGKADPFALCIKRLIYKKEPAGTVVHGLCSNFLCDLKKGDAVQITGPYGRKFVLPVEEEIRRSYIFIATGTGIAPFRAFIQRLYSDVPNFSDPVYLLFGGRYKSEMLYEQEFSAIKDPNFHYWQAVSREMKNRSGGRYYVPDFFKDRAEEIWPAIKNPGTLIYVCGLKSMEDGVRTAIQDLAKSKNCTEEEISEIESRMEIEVY